MKTMRIQSNRRVIAASGCGLVVLLVALAAGYLLRPYFLARALLRDVSSLQVGKSSFADAKRVAEKWDGTISDDCTPTQCSWHRWIDNFELPEWWRGEGEIFSAGFGVSDGIVDERGTAFWIGTGPGVSSASVQEKLRWKDSSLYYFFGKTYLVEPQYSNDNPHYRVFVRLKSDAPLDIRKKYLSFDLNCLWKLHGCEDAKQLLPTAEWN
jgi:hypothetical protein